MISDDTEHTLLVAQSLLENDRDAADFQRRLGRRLRWWFAALPAGCGRATARACLKLWLGIPASRSGVFSAGNGPAMRSAVIGAYFHDQPILLEQFVRAATVVTHTDPQALHGALTVARLAAWAIKHDADSPPDQETLAQLLAQSVRPDDFRWQNYLAAVLSCYKDRATVAEMTARIGVEKGVSSYIYHTVPVAVYAWLRHYGDFRATIAAALECGGDTDTVCAIAGALAAATVGVDGIPPKWIAGIMDWPRSASLLRAVAQRLAEQKCDGRQRGAIPYFWPAILPRNLLFFLVVLLHVFRRLLPPY
jgi:ADP-ribosylglycohydrolase